jgi:hypothetical protein
MQNIFLIRKNRRISNFSFIYDILLWHINVFLSHNKPAAGTLLESYYLCKLFGRQMVVPLLETASSYGSEQLQAICVRDIFWKNECLDRVRNLLLNKEPTSFFGC